LWQRFMEFIGYGKNQIITQTLQLNKIDFSI
jgi:hypothetical protein